MNMGLEGKTVDAKAQISRRHYCKKFAYEAYSNTAFTFKKLLTLFLRCIAVAVFVFSASSLWAWSSKDYPLFDPIHQMAIQNVLSNQVSQSDLEILKTQQIAVDTNQAAAQSYEHSMTGILKSGDTAKIETPIFIKLSEDFIHTNLAAAIAARKAGSNELAFACLGQAIHPLEDATSPAHESFQSWSYNESWWAMAAHVSKERIYPDDKGDTNQVAERIHLEGSVQYAFDIYTEKTSMPERFFNPTNGYLEIPNAYLHRKN